MAETTAYTIFKTRSRTFFVSSLFFPPTLRDDVFTLYSFVRTADDLVDALPPRRDDFFSFKNAFEQAYNSGHASNQPLIDNFISLMRQKDIPYAWIEAFFAAMAADLTKKEYAAFAELETYMYGSAEIVGLAMTKLIGLSNECHEEAAALGRAFQYINFIRDLREDLALGRQYIPREALEPFGFSALSPEAAARRPDAFNKLIRREIERYYGWQKQGENGFRHIPRRLLIPIKTAADLYRYAARRIERTPHIVLERPVKPRLARMMGRLAYNALTV